MTRHCFRYTEAVVMCCCRAHRWSIWYLHEEVFGFLRSCSLWPVRFSPGPDRGAVTVTHREESRVRTHMDTSRRSWWPTYPSSRSKGGTECVFFAVNLCQFSCFAACYQCHVLQFHVLTPVNLFMHLCVLQSSIIWHCPTVSDALWVGR